ncbi:MAG: hypothetical protein R3B74_11185 [Nitrospirales bacterium]|nr:hypothetical protein [Nitrospirales bacterium]
MLAGYSSSSGRRIDQRWGLDSRRLLLLTTEVVVGGRFDKELVCAERCRSSDEAVSSIRGDTPAARGTASCPLFLFNMVTSDHRRLPPKLTDAEATNGGRCIRITLWALLPRQNDLLAQHLSHMELTAFAALRNRY